MKEPNDILSEEDRSEVRLDLSSFQGLGKNMSLNERVDQFFEFTEGLKARQSYSYQRQVISTPGREVTILDPYTLEKRSMLMFASNNYLGLANHPKLKKRINEAMDTYGIGIGGPPLLNGYTELMNNLENQLAELKNQEAAMIFSAGYNANLGLLASITKRGDLIIYDELSHASFLDGLRFAKASSVQFKHNDIEQLEQLLKKYRPQIKGEIFVGVEGVYSMDGDLAPLDEMIPIIRKYGAKIILDDAHGTGILGKSGTGTSEFFNICEDVDIAMGTFSKAFSMTGGFLASSKATINYLKHFSRPFMFSAALPPITLAAVLAGIEVIKEEPELRTQLLDNARYATEKLRRFGLKREPQAAIIALKVPEWMDIRKANLQLHQKGIFVNAIEYPAVPLDQQRFRISLVAEHTRQDIDRLVKVIEEVWESKP